MTHLISCEFNMDTACVELKFTDGSMIAIDTIAVENEVTLRIGRETSIRNLISNFILQSRSLVRRAYLLCE